MNDRNSKTAILENDFPALVGWLAIALVPVISWTFNA